MLAQLVINSSSRRGSDAADAVRASLRAHGVAFYEKPEPGVLPDLLIGAGGDGTIGGLVAEAIVLDIPLAVIPLGTFNELARTLAIPLDIDGACALIASGVTRTIDVGRVNGAYFLSEASIGLSSRITRLQTPKIKRRFGLFGVFGTALQSFRHLRPINAVAFDDNGEKTTFTTVQLTIANSHRFGGFFSAAGASIDDGWLDLYSIEARNAFEAFSVVRAVLGGKRKSVPGFRTLRSRVFDVRTNHRHHIVADGEPAGYTPARFEVFPLALRICAANESGKHS